MPRKKNTCALLDYLFVINVLHKISHTDRHHTPHTFQQGGIRIIIFHVKKLHGSERG